MSMMLAGRFSRRFANQVRMHMSHISDLRKDSCSDRQAEPQ